MNRLKNPKTFVVVLSILVLLLGASLVTVYAQQNIPQVATACETKSGALSAFNDGFSSLTECPKNSRVVSLGQPQTGGGSQGAGEIAFAYSNNVLKKDGTVWMFYNGSWNPIDAPWDRVPIDTSQIVQWSSYSLLDTDGNVWIQDYTANIWVNAGHP